MITTDDISENLYQRLEQLPSTVLVQVMFAALETMQSYNGQSIQHTILDAIGAHEVKAGKWKLPDVDAVKEFYGYTSPSVLKIKIQHDKIVYSNGDKIGTVPHNGSFMSIIRSISQAILEGGEYSEIKYEFKNP